MTSLCKHDAAAPQEDTLEQLGIAEHTVPTPTLAEPVPGVPRAWVFRNVLSESECAAFIERVETTKKWHQANGNTRYRWCDRTMINNDDLAAVVETRLGLTREGVLPDDLWRCAVSKEWTQVHPEEIGTEGVWTPHTLNGFWRCCKYDTGGHFAPHHDGVTYVDNDRSFLTVMLYLTGGFDGGETVFLKETVDVGVGVEEPDILARVVPEPGLCLVFWQCTMHAGMPVVRNSDQPWKYILRSELLFSKVEDLDAASSTSVDALTAAAAASDGGRDSSWDPDAVALLRQAQALETAGQYQESIALYNRLRFKYPELAAAVGVV